MKNREEFSFRNIIRRIVVDDNGKAPTIFVSVIIMILRSETK